mmetsp:Transcript_548/g.1566  ORF Transcript_548/g.1566 Transcript_548/m.1566 type:complete len:235 (-) Transcript_548:1413-2117(-)
MSSSRLRTCCLLSSMALDASLICSICCCLFLVWASFKADIWALRTSSLFKNSCLSLRTSSKLAVSSSTLRTWSLVISAACCWREETSSFSDCRAARAPWRRTFILSSSAACCVLDSSSSSIFLFKTLMVLSKSSFFSASRADSLSFFASDSSLAWSSARAFSLLSLNSNIKASFWPFKAVSWAVDISAVSSFTLLSMLVENISFNSTLSSSRAVFFSAWKSLSSLAFRLSTSAL